MSFKRFWLWLVRAEPENPYREGTINWAAWEYYRNGQPTWRDLHSQCPDPEEFGSERRLFDPQNVSSDDMTCKNWKKWE